MKFYEWTVKIRVADTWVEDGFELTKDRLHDILMNTLPYAYGHEIDEEIVEAPDPKEIRREQGYVDE